jgi:hypothetical protein
MYVGCHVTLTPVLIVRGSEETADPRFADLRSRFLLFYIINADFRMYSVNLPFSIKLHSD